MKFRKSLVMLLTTSMLLACNGSDNSSGISESDGMDGDISISEGSGTVEENGITNSDGSQGVVVSGFNGAELNTNVTIESIASVDGLTLDNEIIQTYEFDNETRITYKEYPSGGFKEFLITNPLQNDIVLYVDENGAPTNAVIGDTTIEYSVENSLLVGATLNDDSGNEYRYTVVDGQFYLDSEVEENSKSLGSVRRVAQSCPANENLKRRFCYTVGGVAATAGILATFTAITIAPVVAVPLLFASIVCVAQGIEPDLPPSPASSDPALCGDPPEPEPEPEPEPNSCSSNPNYKGLVYIKHTMFLGGDKAGIYEQNATDTLVFSAPTFNGSSSITIQGEDANSSLNSTLNTFNDGDGISPVWKPTNKSEVFVLAGHWYEATWKQRLKMESKDSGPYGAYGSAGTTNTTQYTTLTEPWTRFPGASVLPEWRSGETLNFDEIRQRQVTGIAPGEIGRCSYSRVFAVSQGQAHYSSNSGYALQQSSSEMSASAAIEEP